MGQGKSKPTRVVVTDTTEIADNVTSGVDEDDINNNIDTLGITAEESNYPEPKPQHKEPIHVLSAPTSTNGNQLEPNNTTSASLSLNDNASEDEGPSEYQVEMLPVGASFQKFFKKTSEIDFLDMEFYDKSRTNQLNSVSVEFIPKSVTVSRSTSHSVTVSRADLSRVGTAKQVASSLSKRDLMLAERERFETERNERAKTPMGSMRPIRGQVRRFTFESMSMPQNQFQNIEDTLADDLSEKHRDHRAETYASLINDLTADIQTDKLKVKVILSWMSKQNIGQIQFFPKAPPTDTPNGYMMLIQNGQGTYPVFFALLCRAADIKCSIISGVSKGSNYEVGSTNVDGLRNTWNAVYVGESWQLVHPLWVCRGLSRRQQPGWLTIEREGRSKREFSTGNTGRDVQAFNNYFIFTKPEEFIHRNFPDEEKWQLLPKPLTHEEFLAKSYLRPCFFQSRFILLSDDKCVQISETGESIEIVIGYPPKIFTDVMFGYELSIKVDADPVEAESVEQDTAIVTEDIHSSRFVFVRKEESKVTFEIRFSQTGVFKVKLYGGLYSDYGNKPPWMMDVQLICSAVLPQVTPLPFDPGPVSWGPGPIAEELGLYVPSHIQGVVYVTQNEEECVYFVLGQPMDVTVELHHVEQPSESLSQYVTSELVTQYDVLVLKTVITYPGEGEYGMRMDVRSRNRLHNACNYIVHTRKERPHEPFYKRKARRIVLEAMQDCNIEAMDRAMLDCAQYGLPETDPDVIGARNKYEFLCCKKELHIAMLVRRIDVAEHALYRTRKANLDVLLSKEIRRVEAHLKFILQLDEGGWTADIPDIDRLSLVELSQLRSPKTEIKLVIISLYMILGVDELFLKDWKNVRRLLRDQEATLVEMARLEKYIDLEAVDEVPIVGLEVVKSVESLIGNYSSEAIRKIDNTAVAYFIWIQSMVQSIKERHNAIELANENQTVSEYRKVSSRAPTGFRRASAKTTVTIPTRKMSSLMTENNFLPKSSMSHRGNPSARQQHSRIITSLSGKLHVREQRSKEAAESPTMPNNQKEHSLLSIEGQRLKSQSKTPLSPGAFSARSKIHRRETTLGTLTPLSERFAESRLGSRLVTARPHNRLLTARASALNDRREPSRLLTAASSKRGSNMDLKSITENTPTLSKGRTLKSIVGIADRRHVPRTPNLVNGSMHKQHSIENTSLDEMNTGYTSRTSKRRPSQVQERQDSGRPSPIKARNGTVTLSK